MTKITVNGQELEALNKTQAAQYLGKSQTALNNILKRNGIKSYQIKLERERYVLLDDLKSLTVARVCA